MRVTILKVLPALTRAGRLSAIETLTVVNGLGMRCTVRVTRFIPVELLADGTPATISNPRCEMVTYGIFLFGIPETRGFNS